MLASWAKMSKWKGVDGPASPFWRILVQRNSSCLSTGCLVDCSTLFSIGWGELATSWPYYFKYYLPNRVFDVEGALVSAAKADSFSLELVRIETPSSVSLVEMLTTLIEDALAFSLDFLFVTVVHCWILTMLGWTHIVSPCGVGTWTRPFSFLLWGLVLITFSSLFEMGTTHVCAIGRSRLNWWGAVYIILAVTFFRFTQSFSTFVLIRAWSHHWKCNNSWSSVPTSCDINSSWDHQSFSPLQDV